MYIHFEDWSNPLFLRSLDEKRLPHAGKIIKAFASEADPRGALGNTALTVVESSGSAFRADERFSYPRRRTYPGGELEIDLQELGLTANGRTIVRSLFRFAYEYGFNQAAMAAKKPNRSQSWLIRHPFHDIDGLDVAREHSSREAAIHLDIFFPSSIEELRSVVDLDNPNTLLGFREGAQWLKEQRLAAEANPQEIS